MTNSPTERFVSYLQSLTEKQERGALAALRRGLGQPPGTVPEMFRYIVPRLPDGLSKRREEFYYLAASLFALHPKSVETGNMGDHMAGTLKGTTGRDALERRFTALLSAHAEDLPDYLRQSISYLKSKEQPVNWVQLLKDLQGWDHEERYVQRNWANAFWRKPAAEPAPSETDEIEE